MLYSSKYEIKIPAFEGPYDLLLFLIERDELDIYNIPITKIINDFLSYIHQQEELNIDLSSDFILFVSTLMSIKAKMLLPRKEINELGEEIDPRQSLIDAIFTLKPYKEAAQEFAKKEHERLQHINRGNIQNEMMVLNELEAEGSEIKTLTVFKLMKAFEKVLFKFNNRVNQTQHVINKYHYTIEDSRKNITQRILAQGKMSFETLFEVCDNRIHAIFYFLSLLELIQQKTLTILLGEGKNNFIIEQNMI
ncbi:MAG: segregation and condensation protein A [Chitinophagaceae bacterium]